MLTVHPSRDSFNEPDAFDEQFGDANVLAYGLPDSPDAEMQAAHDDRRRQEAEWDEVMRHDSTHCRECGLITSGSAPGGCHVQLCDGCLADWMIQQLGPALVREKLRDVDPAPMRIAVRA